VRAIVIGGNGFIGSHLVDRLLAAKWQVVVYDRYPERYRPPVLAVEYVLGEFENIGLLRSILPRVDVVFHLISTTVPQSSNESPIFDVQSNLIGTIRLLEACVQLGVRKVVFVSSGGTVYGIPKALPVQEIHSTFPICSYGIVKLAIEKYFHLFHHLHGLSYTILRPSNPYGPRQNPHGSQGAIAVFLGSVAQDLPITLWGNGEIVRDYFHVTDLAQACIQAATTETADTIFNIGAGEGKSLNQLLTIIESVVNRKLKVEHLPSRLFDVPELVLDVQKANVELLWTTKMSLEEGIADTWKWIKSMQ